MYITGKIKDAGTGETLPMAEIYFSDKNGNYQAGNPGTTADINGNYEISGDGQYITAAYTGYQKQTITATPGTHNFALQNGINLPEVVITGKILWPRILAGIIVLVFFIYIYKKLR